MSDKVEKMPAIHIDRRHQSAPKETAADAAVRGAAQEIQDGKWKLSREQQTELNEVPGLALRDGVTPDVKPWGQEDFDRTDQSLVLAEHPRVAEALAEMERQKSEATTDGQKYVELAAMMHETIEESRRRQRWTGQERWTEDDALEARKGLILSPIQFYRKLMEEGIGGGGNLGNTHDYPVSSQEWDGLELKNEVRYVRTIGSGRILLGRDVKKMRPADRAGRIPLLMVAHRDKPLEVAGMRTAVEEPVQFATLQYPLSTEWMVMRFDEFGVPRTPRFIGWRTALLALIRNGAVTVEEAHQAFPVGTGPEASWYRQQIFEFQERR